MLDFFLVTGSWTKYYCVIANCWPYFKLKSILAAVALSFFLSLSVRSWRENKASRWCEGVQGCRLGFFRLSLPSTKYFSRICKYSAIVVIIFKVVVLSHDLLTFYEWNNGWVLVTYGAFSSCNLHSMVVKQQKCFAWITNKCLWLNSCWELLIEVL